MGLFDKLKKKKEAPAAGSSGGNDKLMELTKGVLAMEKVAKESYLPQIDSQMANTAQNDVLKQAIGLKTDDELRAVLLVKVMERDFNNGNATDPNNIGVITALKDLFGFSTEQAAAIIGKAAKF